MAKNLVIVESPAKAKLLQKFLGSDYIVKACMGHVRDLPDKKSELSEAKRKLPYATLAIDVDNNFEPLYVIKSTKKKVVKELKDLKSKADVVWIATDEDREGEAIGYHLMEILKLPLDKTKRIGFHEITKKAILHSIENPRLINERLFKAQQARRVLDRLVGYKLSPLLWKKVQFGLSAGRVQSVAVRLVVEKEREREAFDAQEHWKLKSHYLNPDFEAELLSFEDKKIDVKSHPLKSHEEMSTVLEHLKDKDHQITSIEQKDAKSRPPAPFTTSTLQQEASTKLGFSVKQTMSIAQKLYEGNVKKKGFEGGFITYMRTDSVFLSDAALSAAKQIIQKEFGDDYTLDTPRKFKTKSKGAQEAHEAIRPTDATLTPDKAAQYLDENQLRLYTLIWQRTVACQMQDARLKKTKAFINAGKAQFLAEGQVVVFPGYMSVYDKYGKRKADSLSQKEKFLPALEEGQTLTLSSLIPQEPEKPSPDASDAQQRDYQYAYNAYQLKPVVPGLIPSQHFTKPPARYTEASLVKKLESLGIGRPSTYAPTINTIQARGYVEKLEDKRLKPTEIGKIVTDFLVEHFPQVLDYRFTADMEQHLDDIAEGESNWVQILKDFYFPFADKVKSKDQSVQKSDVLKARELGNDPKSGKPILVRMGRFGPFVQRGTKDDEKKPDFASLLEHQTVESLTLEEALELLKLPRIVGQDENGEDVMVNRGPYGPYVKVSGKAYSIGDADPYTISLEDALSVVAVAKKKQAERIIADFPAMGIQVLNGPYGPYISDGKKNARVPKGTDPKSLDLDTCMELLRKAPAKGKGRRRAKKSK